LLQTTNIPAVANTEPHSTEHIRSISHNPVITISQLTPSC